MPPKTNTLDEIIELLRKNILMSAVIDACEGNLDKKFEIRKAMYSNGEEGKTAYNVLNIGIRNDLNGITIKKAIDLAFKDIAEEYGKSVYESLKITNLTKEDIGKKIAEWLFKGEDIGRTGMSRIPKGGQVISGVVRDRHGKRGDKKSFDENLCYFLKEELGYVRPWHFETGGHRRNKIISRISENEFYFILEVAKQYDTDGKNISRKFHELISLGIQKYYESYQTDFIEVKAYGQRSRADARIKTADSDILVEIKTGRMSHLTVNKVIKKYENAREWKNDKENITKKVAVLNSYNHELAEHKNNLEGKGFEVITGEELAEGFESALKLLLSKENDFFRRTSIPIADPRALLEILETAYKRPHLLLRRINEQKLEYTNHLLRNALIDLQNGKRNSPAEFADTIHLDYFKNFEHIYKRSLDLDLKGIVFSDLETGGHLGSGKGIFISGIAYHDGNEMVTELNIARNPYEEKRAVERTEERIRNADLIVTYNGNTFDEKFRIERCIANIIKPAKKKHIDIRNTYRKIARAKEYPTSKLQTFERAELGVTRINDISGKQIPRIYEELIYDNRQENLHRVMIHNKLDLISTALLYDMYKEQIHNA